MKLSVVDGDITEQNVDVIVNAWNRNLFPWWTEFPHGVNYAIRRRSGAAPFREVRKFGLLKLGQAVLTSAGQLPYKGIIHVAGITLWRGRASEFSIRESVRNAIAIVNDKGYGSVAFPVIGSGHGRMTQTECLTMMSDEIQKADSRSEAVIVRFNTVDAGRSQQKQVGDGVLAWIMVLLGTAGVLTVLAYLLFPAGLWGPMWKVVWETFGGGPN